MAENGAIFWVKDDSFKKKKAIRNCLYQYSVRREHNELTRLPDGLSAWLKNIASPWPRVSHRTRKVTCAIPPPESVAGDSVAILSFCAGFSSVIEEQFHEGKDRVVKEVQLQLAWFLESNFEKRTTVRIGVLIRPRHFLIACIDELDTISNN